MRKLNVALVAAGFVFLSGCGCLETWKDGGWPHYGGGGPDPDQAGWHQCLFGTRYLPRPLRPYPPIPEVPPNQAIAPTGG